MTLSQLEEQFWRAVRGELPAEALDQWFKGDAKLSSLRRMRIYQHAYWARQEKVLAEIFPRLAVHLGAARFGQLVTAYLRAQPSVWPAIEWIGSELPAFLGPQAGYAPHLKSLSELEWARCEVLLAPDPERPIDLGSLAGIDFASASASLSPAVKLLCLRRAALKAYLDDAVDPALCSEDLTLGCVVFRQHAGSVHRSLGAPEYAALSALASGASFAEVCEVFGEAEEAARCIGRWIRDGFLCDLKAGA